MRDIIIADNQDITNIGLQHLAGQLNHEISKVYVCDTKRSLIDCLTLSPTCIVILDYTFFDFSDITELLILRNKFDKSYWILFSEDFNDNFLKQVVYSEHMFSLILKDSPLEEITAAISLGVLGQRFICNQITNHLLQPNKASNHGENVLTTTEREILKDIASGKTTKEIAFSRNISTHTVVSHRKNIFRKLEVNNVYEATKYAVRAGIIDIGDYYI